MTALSRTFCLFVTVKRLFTHSLVCYASHQPLPRKVSVISYTHSHQMSLGTGAIVIGLSASSRHYSAVVATCRGGCRGVPVGRFVPPSCNFAHYCPTLERLLPRQNASHRSSLTNAGVPKRSTHKNPSFHYPAFLLSLP